MSVLIAIFQLIQQITLKTKTKMMYQIENFFYFPQLKKSENIQLSTKQSGLESFLMIMQQKHIQNDKTQKGVVGGASDFFDQGGELKGVNSSKFITTNISLQSQKSLDIVQTSTLEKSIDLEGKSKINDYTIIKTLGQGSFGKVKLIENSQSEQFVSLVYIHHTFKALKIANKKTLKRKLLSQKQNAFTLLEREIAIMKKMNHENVVRLFEVIDDPQADKLYLVMEMMHRGSILSKDFFNFFTIKNGQLPEQSCRYYFRHFILGLDYLHNIANVIHRDIKPENLLVSKDNILKIADFGVSQIMEDSEERIQNQTGTQAYLAPEAWTQKSFNGKAADIWAGGITLYQMVFGKIPFYSSSTQQLKDKILNENVDFSPPQMISNQLENLIQRMLDKNYNTRITLQQIMEHEWVTENGKSPLQNYCEKYTEVTEQEISSALTKLNIQMAFKTATKLLSKLKSSRSTIQARHSHFSNFEEKQ